MIEEPIILIKKQKKLQNIHFFSIWKSGSDRSSSPTNTHDLMDMDVGQPTEVAAASRPFLAFFSSSAQIAEEQARPCIVD